MTRVVYVLAYAGLLLLAACQAGPSRRERYDAVYRSAKAVQSAVTVGVPLSRYRELVTSLASEVTIARDRAARPDDTQIAEAYATALADYVDALDLWALKVERDVDAIPDYSSPRVAAIAKAQGLPLRPAPSIADTLRKLKQPVGGASEERPNYSLLDATDETMSTIWRHAAAHLEAADNLLK